MKRICASFLAIVMLFATYGYASAVNVTSSRASLTLSRYFAEALTGSGRGEIIISYDVKSSKIATVFAKKTELFLSLLNIRRFCAVQNPRKHKIRNGGTAPNPESISLYTLTIVFLYY